MAAKRRSIDGNFAAFLKAAMDAAGIPNGNQLAERVDVAASMVNRWLRAESLPTIDNLRVISPHIGVPMRELVVVAGYLTREEQGLGDDPTPPTGRHTVEDEIRADPRIRDDRKEPLIALLESLREEHSDSRTDVRDDRRA